MPVEMKVTKSVRQESRGSKMNSFINTVRLSRQRKECLWNVEKFYVNIKMAVKKNNIW